MEPNSLMTIAYLVPIPGTEDYLAQDSDAWAGEVEQEGQQTTSKG